MSSAMRHERHKLSLYYLVYCRRYDQGSRAKRSLAKDKSVDVEVVAESN